MSFLNDIGVKGPRSRYNDEEIFNFPGIRRFVMEYIQNFDAVLTDLKRVEATMSAEKSMFCMTELKIVEYICDVDGRYSDSLKVLKILSWERCDNVIEARAFIGICGYYRIWIGEYVFITESIYELF
jgi:hypothetical protein